MRCASFSGRFSRFRTSSVEVEGRQHGVHGHGDRPHSGHDGLQGLLIALWEDVETGARACFSLDGVPALPNLQKKTEKFFWS